MHLQTLLYYFLFQLVVSYLIFLKGRYFGQYKDKERITIFNAREDLYLFKI
jgi:hypothetical protein